MQFIDDEAKVENDIIQPDYIWESDSADDAFIAGTSEDDYFHQPEPNYDDRITDILNWNTATIPKYNVPPNQEDDDNFANFKQEDDIQNHRISIEEQNLAEPINPNLLKELKWKVYDIKGQAARWFITDNKYGNTINEIEDYFKTISEYESLLKYACWQLEKGTHVHVQGTFVFHKPLRFNRVKSMFNVGCHIEKVKNIQKAIAYCMKTETRVIGPYFYNKEAVLKMVKRKRSSTVAQLTEDIQGGCDTDFVYEQHGPQIIRYGENRILNYFSHFIQHRNGTTNPVVILCTGPTRSGKSHWAFNTFKHCDIYYKPRGRWFDKYKFEKYVLMDEFAPSEIPVEILLSLLDKFPLTLECKGSHTKMVGTNFIITSSVPFQDWYTNNRREELKERITHILQFPKSRNKSLEELNITMNE